MLFSCSIRDNIAYGAMDPEAVSNEDIFRAARVANAYNFIQAFPKGFDTVVGEKGVLLSGETLRSHLIYQQEHLLPPFILFAVKYFYSGMIVVFMLKLLVKKQNWC